MAGDYLLDAEATQEAWRTFVDLVIDLGDFAAEMGQADRKAVAIRLDMPSATCPASVCGSWPVLSLAGY